MPIKITKAFQWSPNGYDVATIESGEYESLPERASEIAVQLGALAEEAAAPSPASDGSAPQVPAEGQGQVANNEQPGGESAVVATQTSETTRGAFIAGGADAPEAKAGRRRNRTSEPANG